MTLADDAVQAAQAALAPYVHQLGLTGLPIERVAAIAVRAAMPVVVSGVRGDELPRRRATEQLLQDRIGELALERDAYAGELPALRSRIAFLEEQLGKVTRDRNEALVAVAVLRGSLSDIERLPYEGPEPKARRMAREALTR